MPNLAIIIVGATKIEVPVWYSQATAFRNQACCIAIVEDGKVAVALVWGWYSPEARPKSFKPFLSRVPSYDFMLEVLVP